jgi:hypothetical protein
MFRAEEEKEEEDLFVFDDTIEGHRAPAVKPYSSTQASHSSTQARVRAAPLSPVVGQSDSAHFGRLTTLLPHFDPR